ncbi:uncharacterized protein LOC119652497 [Hermetia illucens]|uniref:uncharacterized protein LOC119652497 n=1 Tax=Hermetia illucens TaxID=343691 RepID=UPI0018CBFE5F|nr:uncharacterized protein LOC119652497 [Hermetia illucens]
MIRYGNIPIDMDLARETKILDVERLIFGMAMIFPFLIIQCRELLCLFHGVYRILRLKFLGGWKLKPRRSIEEPHQLADGTFEFKLWRLWKSVCYQSQRNYPNDQNEDDS